jgi:hypothetical protein
LCVDNSLLFAQPFSNPVHEREEKLDLESGIVQIIDRKFFLNVDGNFLSVSSVNTDEKGTYVVALISGVDIVICHQ